MRKCQVMNKTTKKMIKLEIMEEEHKNLWFWDYF